jgi:NAD(P)-dependent dehydrogenase (short-subunit alcohol dehydrogenase family)
MRIEAEPPSSPAPRADIGRGTARALAKRGCNLALADLDEDGLADTAALAAETGVKVSRHGSTSPTGSGGRLPESVLAAHGRADLLFNNAGVAIGGTFEQVAEKISTG